MEGLDLKFEIEVPNVNEESLKNETPLEYLKRITISKLDLDKVTEENIYISSDTIVVYQNQILQKPVNYLEAVEILKSLNSNTHSVYSGLGIYSKGKIIFDYEESIVQFKKWNDEDRKNYINLNQPFDKAGSYGIQDKGSPVKNFKGSYTNIMGFPIRKFFIQHEHWNMK